MAAADWEKEWAEEAKQKMTVERTPDAMEVDMPEEEAAEEIDPPPNPFLKLPFGPFNYVCSFLEVKDLLVLEETSKVVHTHQLPSVWSDCWNHLQRETTKKDYEPILGELSRLPTDRPYPGFSNDKGRFFREHARRVREPFEQVSAVLARLQTHHHGWVFSAPVDPVELDLPDYFEIIKKPMDYGTIYRKLKRNRYRTYKQVVDDLTLVTDNGKLFTEQGTVLHDIAVELETVAKRELNFFGLA